VLVPGGLVAERLVNGQADVALHQISEILAVPGAKNYTVYAGALSTGERDPAAARALLDALKGPGAAAVLKDMGNGASTRKSTLAHFGHPRFRNGPIFGVGPRPRSAPSTL
jgi:hypothetical protein